MTQFGSDSGSSNGDDADDLPFPAPLPRSDFLKPDFDPSTYLSSLGHRHQTLEDLREDLRSRSQQLNSELLDLVNSHYQDFLSLGSSLRGGTEKVEELRVGLMSFQREVEDVRRQVVRQEDEVEGLLRERVHVQKEIALGRQLLDLNARLGRLEDRLMVVAKGSAEDGAEDTDNECESSGDEYDEDGETRSDDVSQLAISKLRRNVDEFRLVESLVDHIGIEHPLVAAERPRMMRLRNTLLLDLGAALKRAKALGPSAQDYLLKILGLYRDLDVIPEAVEILKTRA